MHFSRMVLVLGLTLSLGYLCALYQVLSVAGSSFSPDISSRTLVVLGKRTYSEPDRDFQARIDRLSQLLAQSPALPVIASGGAVGGSLAEAQWIALALPMYQLTLEGKSQTTRENLGFSSKLSDNPSLAVLTSRYHIARTSVIAAQQNLDVVFVPADESWVWSWSNTTSVLREAALYWPTSLGW